MGSVTVARSPMTAPLTGAADAPDVPASPMPAAVRPTTKIVRIMRAPFDHHRPRCAFTDTPRAVPPSLPFDLRTAIAHLILPSIWSFQRYLHSSIVHFSVISLRFYVHYPGVDARKTIGTSTVDEVVPRNIRLSPSRRLIALQQAIKGENAFAFCSCCCSAEGPAGSTSRRNEYLDSCTNILQGF